MVPDFGPLVVALYCLFAACIIMGVTLVVMALV